MPRSSIPPETRHRCRIVLTGGPGGGKTTAADLFRREIGERVVIFFESAAVGGMGIEGGNPARKESLEEAVALDARLRLVWSKHPRFIVVNHHPLFFRKIARGLEILSELVGEAS